MTTLLSRTMMLRGANLALFLSFCAAGGTGLVLAFRLPPGSRGGHGLRVLDWSRHEWGDLHFWCCMAAVGLVALHLALHHAWLRKVAGKSRLIPLLAGLTAGAVLLVGPLLLPVTGR